MGISCQASQKASGGDGPYLTGRGLHQTLCLAQSGCQESGTQEGHKHKKFLSPDNLFSQKKVSDSCLNPKRKARAQFTVMQKWVFLGPTRNSLSCSFFLNKLLFPIFSRYANSTSLSRSYFHCIFTWVCKKYSLSISVFPLVLFCLPNELFYYRNKLHFQLDYRALKSCLHNTIHFLQGILLKRCITIKLELTLFKK